MKYEDWIRLEEKRLKKEKPIEFRPGLGSARKPHLPEHRAPNREAFSSPRRNPVINVIRSLWGM
jgi:hypothetical protein